MTSPPPMPGLSGDADARGPMLSGAVAASTQRVRGENWTPAEHKKYLDHLPFRAQGWSWRKIAKRIGTKNTRQVMTHHQKFEKKVRRMIDQGIEGNGARMQHRIALQSVQHSPISQSLIGRVLASTNAQLKAVPDSPSSSSGSGSCSGSGSDGEQSPSSQNGRQQWSAIEHERFLEALPKRDEGWTWKDVAAYVGTRSSRQVMTHNQKYQEKVRRYERTQKGIPRVEHKCDPDVLKYLQIIMGTSGSAMSGTNSEQLSTSPTSSPRSGDESNLTHHLGALSLFTAAKVAAAKAAAAKDVTAKDVTAKDVTAKDAAAKDAAAKIAAAKAAASTEPLDHTKQIAGVDTNGTIPLSPQERVGGEEMNSNLMPSSPLDYLH